MAAVHHLEFVTLPCWSRHQYMHANLHIWSKFRINRPIRRRDIAKERFSIWCPSAISVCKISISVKCASRNRNLHMHTKRRRNRIIHCWDIEIKLFLKWRPPRSLNLRKLPFWSRGLVWMWLFISHLNFALIGQYHHHHLYPVVKVRGLGSSAPCSHLSPPAIVLPPDWIYKRVILCLNNAKLVGLE